MSKEVIRGFSGAVYFRSFAASSCLGVLMLLLLLFFLSGVAVLLLSVVLGWFSAAIFAVIRPAYLAVLASFGE